MALTPGTTTVPASDDVYVGGDTASADYHRCNGRQLRELAKDPTAATTTINDDSGRITRRVCQRMYVTEGENIYTATLTNPADGAG
ncbi:hypothetical protein OK016_00210 [Vibrio chagasii]|nr:hypothetical protein [Vibrio chagasii]